MTPAEARQQMQRELEADAWPWPMSQDAQRLHGQMRLIRTQVFTANGSFTPAPEMKMVTIVESGDGKAAHDQKFNRAEHERFMRGLG